MFNFENIERDIGRYMDHERMTYIDALAEAIRIQINQLEIILGVEGLSDEKVEEEIQAGYGKLLKELERRGIHYDGRHTLPRKEDDPFEVAKSLEIGDSAVQGTISSIFQRDWYTFTPVRSGKVKFELKNLSLEQFVMIFLNASDGCTNLNLGANQYPPKDMIEFSHSLTEGSTYFLQILPLSFGALRPIRYSLVVSYECN